MSTVTAEEQIVVVNSRSKGDRGEVGTATSSQSLKHLWRQAKSGISLKRFARQLLKTSDKPEETQLVKSWLANKHGALNAKRSETNIKRIALEKSATRAARK